MPTILRIGPYRFYFFSHEPNKPPHVHVELRELERLVDEHRETMLEAWYGYFGG